MSEEEIRAHFEKGFGPVQYIGPDNSMNKTMYIQSFKNTLKFMDGSPPGKMLLKKMAAQDEMAPFLREQVEGYLSGDISNGDAKTTINQIIKRAERIL